MHHFFFFLIHSLAQEHLSCFQFLSVLNKAAVNIVGQCLCDRMEHPLGICPEVFLSPLKIVNLIGNKLLRYIVPLIRFLIFFLAIAGDQT